MPTVSPSLLSRARYALIAVPILLLLTLGSWALASPVGSSPDDDFHLASIWCGQGERPGICEQAGSADSRLVPTPLLNATCYAFQPQQSADCWNPDAKGLGSTERVNTGPLYPPLFYATMSTFATADVQSSVVAMRLVNAALYVVMLTVVFVALPRRLRPALVISALGTLVPLGLFIIASTNPSSWALLSATIVWICAYGALQTTGARQIVLAALAVLGTVIGAGARADAGIFAVFGVLLAFVLGWRRRERMLVPLLSAALILAAALGFYFSAKQGGALMNGLPTTNPPLTVPQLISNVLGIPALWSGALGGWGLGWLDTTMPAIVPTFATAVFFAAFAIGIRRLAGRHLIAVLLTVGAIWGVPFILLAQSHALVGSDVQPRYILPLLIIMLGVASAEVPAVRAWRGPRVVFAGAALTAASVVALDVNLNRYTKGVLNVSIDPGVHAKWWWPVAPSPLTLVLVAGLAFAAIFVIFAVVLQRQHALTCTARAAVPGPETPPVLSNQPAPVQWPQAQEWDSKTRVQDSIDASSDADSR